MQGVLMPRKQRKAPSTFLTIFGIGLLAGLAAFLFLSGPQPAPTPTAPSAPLQTPVDAPAARNASTPASSPATAPTRVQSPSTATSIVTWNIEWFPGQSSNATAQQARTHMAAAQQAIREIGADIWLLQEMRDRLSVEELFTDFPYQVHLVSGHLYRGSLGTMQTAIVSRFPAIDSGWENFVASDGARAPPRGFSWAVLNVGGEPLIVLTTHLKANPGDPAQNIRTREESARQMLAHIERLSQRYPEAPVVVGGDFNLLLNQPGMAHERTLALFQDAGFHDGWEGVPFAERVTWPGRGRFGDACFDYLLTRGLGEVRAEVMKGWERLSDHRPVRLLIQIQGTERRR